MYLFRETLGQNNRDALVRREWIGRWHPRVLNKLIVNNMKRINHFCLRAWSIILFLFVLITGAAHASDASDIPRLDNPMTVQYLKKNLRKSHPRLVLNSSTERHLRQKLKTDPVIRNMYKAIQLNSVKILEEPLLERIQTGKRLLSVSREMLYRMNMLGMVYRIDKDPEILKRINDELVAVCNFSDWNPSHFLDVGEMAMAVAIGLDWTAGDLPKSTTELAQNALIQKNSKNIPYSIHGKNN